MAEAYQSLGTVQFGPFELLLDTLELRKHGIPVNLSGQAIQILVVLTANPGRLISREELQQKLLPGAGYGDPEHGLNAAINKLREKLGDSAVHSYVHRDAARAGLPLHCGGGVFKQTAAGFGIRNTCCRAGRAGSRCSQIALVEAQSDSCRRGMHRRRWFALSVDSSEHRETA
jgi:hypothetical protein